MTASSVDDREVVDEMLMLQLMPEAFCQLLNTEPWQQIASKVSCSRHFFVLCLILPNVSVLCMIPTASHC